jgi:hypothetical protein
MPRGRPKNNVVIKAGIVYSASPKNIRVYCSEIADTGRTNSPLGKVLGVLSYDLTELDSKKAKELVNKLSPKKKLSKTKKLQQEYEFLREQVKKLQYELREQFKK